MSEGWEEKSGSGEREGASRGDEGKRTRPSACVVGSRMMGTLPRCVRTEDAAAARRRCDMGEGESRPKVLSISKSDGLV